MRARAVHAAFNCADRHTADRRRLLIGEFGDADHDQRFAVRRGEFGERGAEVAHLEIVLLTAAHCDLRRVDAV